MFVSILVVVVGAFLYVLNLEFSIVINSEPQGAEIYVNRDENPKGVTPNPLDLKHIRLPRIRLKMKGYRNGEVKITFLQFALIKLLTAFDRIEPLNVMMAMRLQRRWVAFLQMGLACVTCWVTFMNWWKIAIEEITSGRLLMARH